MKPIVYDFQGWPMEAHTFREILKTLGFKEEDGKISIDSDNPLLDAYPCVFEEDGMGYGIDPQLIIEAEKDVYNRTAKILNVPNITEEAKKLMDELGAVPSNKNEDYHTETLPVFNLFTVEVDYIDEEEN